MELSIEEEIYTNELRVLDIRAAKLELDKKELELEERRIALIEKKGH